MTAIRNELALFQQEPKERSIQAIKWINFRPTSQVSNTSAIEFNIPGTSSDYIHLPKSWLKIQCRILRTDGTPVDNTDDVALVNLSMHSLFRQVDVLLNQKPINSNVGLNYPYKSMIDTLVNYSHDVKDSQLQSEGYFKDTAFFMDDTQSNAGHVQRKNLTKHGIVDFQSVLHVDLAQTNRSLLNGIQVQVKLFQHDDAFRLLSANGARYGVEIVDAVFKVCHIQLKPSVLVAQDELLQKRDAQYPVWQSNIKTWSVPQGSFSFSVDDIFHNEVPARLYLAVTSSAGYTGDFSRNPFNFHHYYLNYVELCVDGVSRPAVALQPNYQDNPDAVGQTLSTGYVTEFLSLFKTNYPQAQGNWIQRADYPGGYAIYVFDLKPGASTTLFTEPQTGHTRINARFARALPEPVTIIAYGVFPDKFTIDHTRSVII